MKEFKGSIYYDYDTGITYSLEEGEDPILGSGSVYLFDKDGIGEFTFEHGEMKALYTLAINRMENGNLVVVRDMKQLTPKTIEEFKEDLISAIADNLIESVENDDRGK